MIFHCGPPFCRAFVMDMGKDSQKVLPGGPVQDELTNAIERSGLVSAPCCSRL